MVSTHSQYITDFTPKTMEPGKSPLALLAKTCETIGLPDASSKKAEKKDSSVSASVPKKISPRSTPASKEAPSMTFPGLPKPGQFPPMPPMPFPFFNPMMPYPMAFPPFPMARMPCPFAMMRQPCLTPGCIQCTPTSSASGAAMPDMMHPLFNAYSYQSLLASAAAASQQQQQQQQQQQTTPKTSPKIKCNWAETNGICGKKFADEDELTHHVKTVHTPSPPASTETKSTTPPTTTSTSTSAGGPMKTPVSRPSSSASTSARFNPYAKPTTPMMAMPPLNPLMLPFPLQAMYTQRLMSSMPQ